MLPSLFLPLVAEVKRKGNINSRGNKVKVLNGGFKNNCKKHIQTHTHEQKSKRKSSKAKEKHFPPNIIYMCTDIYEE